MGVATRWQAKTCRANAGAFHKQAEAFQALLPYAQLILAQAAIRQPVADCRRLDRVVDQARALANAYEMKP